MKAIVMNVLATRVLGQQARHLVHALIFFLLGHRQAGQMHQIVVDDQTHPGEPRDAARVDPPDQTEHSIRNAHPKQTTLTFTFIYIPVYGRTFRA